MPVELINLCGSESSPNWIEAKRFVEEWKQDRPSFTLTTSGSTGAPKEIELTRNQLEYSARETIQALNLKRGDKLLLGINASFIGGKMLLVRGLINQMPVYVTEPSANPLDSIIEQIDFAALVPLQIETIISSGSAEKLNQMKAIIVGGAPVSRNLENQIMQLSVPIHSTYGMTETASHIALRQLNGQEKSDYFSTLGDIKIDIDDRGCLTLKGTITGNKKIVTNDLVELVNDKQFKWLGRFDNVINSGGIKISPEEVENKLERIFTNLGLKRRYFISGIPDNRFGQKMILVIEGTGIDFELLNAQLSDELPKYHRPKKVVFIDKFIETESGKINRKATINTI